ncbi:MAG: hypothetical protein H7301_07355 [Cryobacterium sp.]|nr:hypothetical protein [Oligoflexia bacterium]
MAVPLIPHPLHIEKNFTKAAKPLRQAFERKFVDPRNTQSDRFVWDYWHIENQYSVLRTPARHYFPKKLFDQFERDLQTYGQTKLGCNGISDPWLSLYVDGSFQNFHADSPHGPWAYVYSLTPWAERIFRGGETLLAKNALLNFWPNFKSDGRNDRGIEFDDLFESIPAEFNQLTVFDPRLPHGVKEVRGTREPLKGRLVIHGWFVEPRPFIEGGLRKNKKTVQILNSILEPLAIQLGEFDQLQGTLSIRVTVSPAGKPGKQELLTHTLLNISDPDENTTALSAIRTIAEALDSARFPPSEKVSRITLPFLFRS